MESDIFGNTENPQTMATWVHNMDPIMTKSGDLKKMSGSGDDLQTVHKEVEFHKTDVIVRCFIPP